MSNTASNQMQATATAAAAAIGGEPVTRTIIIALTGDAVSDLMAAIRKVSDDSGLSARQVQFIMECYSKLYKDAADTTERILAQQPFRAKTTPMPEMPKPYVGDPPPADFTWGGVLGQIDRPITASEIKAEVAELRRKIVLESKERFCPPSEARALFIEECKKLGDLVGQSGTHSPSTHLPVSSGSEPNGGGSPGWPEDGSVMKGPPPGGWPVDDKY